MIRATYYKTAGYTTLLCTPILSTILAHHMFIQFENPNLPELHKIAKKMTTKFQNSRGGTVAKCLLRWAHYLEVFASEVQVQADILKAAIRFISSYSIHRQVFFKDTLYKLPHKDFRRT